MRSIIHWTARIIGTLLALFMLFMAQELIHGPSFSSLSGDDQMKLIGNAVMVLGVLLAWKWAGWGGIMVIVGYAANARASQELIRPILWIFPAVAVLFLTSWYLRRSERSRDTNVTTRPAS